jgi:hypothetical protein
VAGQQFLLSSQGNNVGGIKRVEESNVKNIGPRNCGRRITAGITFAWRKKDRAATTNRERLTRCKRGNKRSHVLMCV